ncbi:MAG: ABC transporter ATP-binding protein [Proteobacteria bacterium]|nr:ABC transporter ATP-binding protein [Pseudomonadota bacterium]
MAESVPAQAVFSASELQIAFGAKPLLQGGTIAILEGERVGLVGRNGCGKSTFLKIAAGVISPDSGTVTTRRGLLTGYLPQEFELEPDLSVHDAVLRGAAAVQALIEEYENAPADAPNASQLLERIEHLDGWTLDSRAKSLLTNLNAPAPHRIVGNLSGGEKRRIALCRSLIARPDLLILDEPTNHLDTDSIQWLEDFLARYSGTCLFVTHDRYFLDRVCNRIVEIHQGGFVSFPGNYTDYLIAQAEREAVSEQTEKKRQKFLRSELEWVRRAPGARRTKSQDRVDRYFEAAAQGPPEKASDADIILPTPKELGNRVISLKNVGADVDGRQLFSGLTLEIPAGARIGIVGRNGSGKTTLLRILTGELEPTRGTVERGARTRETVRLGTEDISLRGYLRRFLFNETQMGQLTAQLSGGERSRVLLAKILKRGGNVLLLDEPTNDLDLATLRVLEEALVRFKGTVIVVSHDRYFMNRVCTHTLAFEGDELRFDVGNYEEFIQRRAERMAKPASPPARKPAAVTPAVAPATAAPTTTRPQKLSWKEERDLETIEARILEAEAALALAEAQSNSPDFYKQSPAEMAASHESLISQRQSVAALYTRWDELELKRAALAE